MTEPLTLLTFHCSVQDADMLSEAIRTVSHGPVHITEKTVRGWDYDDASTAEQVEGLLRRTALQVIVPNESVTAVIDTVAQTKHALPVRWAAVPVLQRGRIA
ncbi:MAG: DUF3240 family protein [Nevskiaceae bacterium]|jgi:hypothetical protein|nr:DUF3240 family protein [Nevskiaceae bacterium]